jgi:Holliday junction resolvase RusA-like endonuclease
MRLLITIEGLKPVPQGSMTASYNRKMGVAHVHHVQGSALALWRATIRMQAQAAGATLSPLPISMRIGFGMPRPKSHLTLKGGKYVVKMQHYYDRPAHAPDIDKLARAVCDSLTSVCYNDDSQIVELYVTKIYSEVTVIEVTDEISDERQTLPFGMG